MYHTFQSLIRSSIDALPSRSRRRLAEVGDDFIKDNDIGSIYYLKIDTEGTSTKCCAVRHALNCQLYDTV